MLDNGYLNAKSILPMSYTVLFKLLYMVDKR